MKKWVAPLLVLALAVLFILGGKHITEKIMNSSSERDNRNFQYYIAAISPPDDIPAASPAAGPGKQKSTAERVTRNKAGFIVISKNSMAGCHAVLFFGV